jgi:hypothetical protein
VVWCLRVRGRAALSARGPPGARGRSARSWLTECSSCCSCVLAHLCFDLFFQEFSVAGCLADGPHEIHRQFAWCAILADGPRCLHGRSLLRVQYWWFGS